MPASQVRSDYDQLQNVAKNFGSQSQTFTGMNQNLQSCVDTLRGGDWQGEGARAFLAEWDNSVMPTLKRLQEAMAEAERAVAQISQVMKQAEDGASQVLHF